MAGQVKYEARIPVEYEQVGKGASKVYEDTWKIYLFGKPIGRVNKLKGMYAWERGDEVAKIVWASLGDAINDLVRDCLEGV